MTHLGTTETPAAAGRTPGERLELELGLLAGRLARLLRTALPADSAGTEGSIAFLEARFRSVAAGRPLDAWSRGPMDRRPAGTLHPLDRLVYGLGLSDAEVDLVLLAALPEEHEGFAEVLRTLHPAGRPHASVGLAAQLLCPDEQGRPALRRLLATGPAVAAGALVLEGEDPFFLHSLHLADRLWPALHGVDAWPAVVARRGGQPALQGLEGWFQEPAVRQARRVLESFQPRTVLVTAEDEELAFERASALAAVAAPGTVRIEFAPGGGDAARELERLIALHALARGIVPVLRLAHADGPGAAVLPAFEGHVGPVVVSCRAGAAAVGGSRPLLEVACERLRSSALSRMWAQILPAFEGQAGLLAARYPLEPSAAARVAVDLDGVAAMAGRRLTLEDVGASVRSRAGTSLSAGIRVVRPTAGWSELVLPPERLAQLQEAANRLYHQATVLDDWCFLAHRQGARGVRMLLTGPPGTGKTLSAEVLAREFGVDLLVVDLARVVSKWIGETEKNLAQAFEAAEQARAVLLFDEADALFGKRTDVSDAHDRYANLETAYLLTRLERFEGLAILSTNLRQNIDEAFTRRLEFIVEYQEPDRPERLALWRCHLPERAPLAADVDLEELSALYPMVGGMIRNAAVAAAFLAAAEGTDLHQSHFICAIRREYEKTGKALPAIPKGIPGGTDKRGARQ